MGKVSPAVRAAAEARLLAFAEEEAAGDGSTGNDRGFTFGHVVVDEAQDLSAMQWRMLARRCPSRSMTVVGDLAQATTPWAAHGWDDVADRAGAPDATRVELTIGYRTPAEVMELAARVLAVAHPELAAPMSVRRSGRDPVFIDAGTDLAGAVAAARGDDDDRLSAVIGPAGSVAEAQTVAEVKGLEFDRVVVVEPAALVRESGLTGLYVALTRTTGELAIVHREPVPDVLDPADALSAANRSRPPRTSDT